jgi:hypothetical protein
MKQIFSFLLLLSSLTAAAPRDPEIVVNNRILVEVGKRKISVIDVMRRLDMALARHSPEALGVPAARHQFYSKEWQTMLSQMVDQELMLADAEKLKVTVTDGEVHETLRDRFGPNVMGNLEKFNLSYDEALEIIRTDLLVQRMSWFRVNLKALQSVGPKIVKSTYQELCEQNPATNHFRYRVLTLQAPTQEAADQLHARMRTRLEEGLDEEAVVAELVKEKQISEQLRTQLLSLTPGTLTQPSYNEARQNYRVLLLKERVAAVPPPFSTVASKIEDQLVERAVARESERYLHKLRQLYSIDDRSIAERLPAGYQPFSLR